MSDFEDEILRHLAELVDLLSLLPSPNDPDETAWWEQFAAAEREARRPGQPHDGWATYMTDKLVGYQRVATTPECRDLATACLMFFDSPSPKMAALAGAALDFNSSGGRLLEAICQVAWRMYVPMEVVARMQRPDRN